MAVPISLNNSANEGGVGLLTLATGSQNGTLTLVGSESQFSGNGTFTANGSSAAVVYSGSGAQTVAATTYNNLTLSGSGAKTVASSTTVTVNGTLTMGGTATATVSGTLSYGAAATLDYEGTAAQTTGSEFPATWSGTGGVKINNASGVTLNAIRTISSSSTHSPSVIQSRTASSMTAATSLRVWHAKPELWHLQAGF